ncbi:MAG: response regulator [Ignavibacteriales bacterium]|nr:response regulator [Ignavibacteriales bacterium]
MTTTTLLIVEDEPTIALSFQHILKGSVDYNYQITSVTTAEAALKTWETMGSFDVVLLDIFLPGESGLEFLKTIRSIDGNAVVVCISGSQDYKVVHDVFKLGADDFISKLELSNHYVLEKAIFAGLAKRQYQREKARLEIAQQRLDAITTIIRTVHHELNNPMAIIKLATSQISSSGEFTEEEFRHYLNQVEENIERMSDVMRRLPYFHEEVLNTQLRGLKLFALPDDPSPKKNR